jgi:hypothetical protein
MNLSLLDYTIKKQAQMKTSHLVHALALNIKCSLKNKSLFFQTKIHFVSEQQATANWPYMLTQRISFRFEASSFLFLLCTQI